MPPMSTDAAAAAKRPGELWAAEAPMPPHPAGSTVWPMSGDVLRSLGVPLTAADQVSMVELGTDRLRGLVSAHILKQRGKGVAASHGPSATSFVVRDGSYSRDDEDEDGACEGAAQCKHTALTLGTGVHTFEHQGETVWAVRQTQGAPVGTDCGAVFHTTVILVVPGKGRESFLHRFCDELVASAEEHVENTYHLFQWNVDRGCWRHQGVRTARPVESVVLPKEQQERVVGDMAEFLSKDTKRFYVQHGIPYKRAYLFWGVPGTGKTSLIQALAGKWKRHVCFMQPTDPKFTDDMLKSAVSTAPSRSLIVFEDIDALFTKGRENRGKSAVTFSGLLNSLDGVGMPDGQVFILTTNFREQLDAALIRNGRVDVHVEFTHIGDEQAAAMFARFFSQDAELADEFVATLHKVLEDRVSQLTPAVLQHFFIQERKNSGRQVIEHIPEVLAELKRRESENDSAKDADKEKEKEKEEAKKKSEEEEAERVARSAAEASKPTAHWHLSISPTVALTVVGALCLPVLCRSAYRRQG
eukprot:TRINITY_DN1004_c0_g2_i2.p1 TRINITY_DN1004_c0_g2~~TRINITY_DN1004_c0_g2_i2.p1  ORF type:complete len:528 (+),score=224.27 TRINITY_DN1004_c0_g2_i2:99-1682(+)